MANGNYGTGQYPGRVTGVGEMKRVFCSSVLVLLLTAATAYADSKRSSAPNANECGPCRREKAVTCQKECVEEEAQQRTVCFAECIRDECGTDCMRDPNKAPK